MYYVQDSMVNNLGKAELPLSKSLGEGHHQRDDEGDHQRDHRVKHVTLGAKSNPGTL
jgi:hypothetical protein